MPFSSLPKSAFIDGDPTANVYVGSQQSSYSPPYSPTYSQPNELGSKTFFWYRIYCGALAALYALVAVMGLVMTYFKPGESPDAVMESTITGIAYAVIGAIFFAVFVFAVMLPAKPYNWIVGIVMIAIGLTSCCLWPATIPLLIYWIKPETRAFFGRN